MNLTVNATIAAASSISVLFKGLALSSPRVISDEEYEVDIPEWVGLT